MYFTSTVGSSKGIWHYPLHSLVEPYFAGHFRLIYYLNFNQCGTYERLHVSITSACICGSVLWLINELED